MKNISKLKMDEPFENDEEDLNSSIKGNELIKGKNKLSFMQKIIIIVIILINSIF